MAMKVRTNITGCDMSRFHGNVHLRSCNNLCKGFWPTALEQNLQGVQYDLPTYSICALEIP